MTEFQKLSEELAKLRREFSSRAVAEIQARIQEKAALLIKIEEMEERFREREKALLGRLKFLGDRQRVMEYHIFGTPEAKIEEDEGHRV